MKLKPQISLLVIFILFFIACGSGQRTESTMAFTVSMEQPHTHYFHVVLQCQGLKGEAQNFKLPVWTPGYYLIMDYSKNVLNFRAMDGNGNELEWIKKTKNTWQVACGKAEVITVSYDVYAFSSSVAESFLDDARAFICPTSVFMFVDGHLNHPVSVTFQLNDTQEKISTGLDPIEGMSNTFSAPDFDILYDCPVLIGTQEIIRFDVQGIPHVIAIEDLGEFDRDKFRADIKRVCEGAIQLFDHIPFKHYTFIMMERGGGGLEHLNSMAVFYNPFSWVNPNGYTRWLAFIAHEYYHLYNVKRIRPITLGPFDYDRENYTNLLWVSEGFTVYYEYIILRRAGLLTREEFFDRVRRFITGYENRPGRLVQSAEEASFNTWMQFFRRSENSANTTISYYDKGAALGLLLDLKIRHETENRVSLDDVMRSLYQKYYQKEKRGFTDAEFRQECENAAGCPLPEIFDVYARTVQEIDYPKYFAYAGLEIDVTPREMPGVFWGAATREQGGRLTIMTVERDSPAWRGGLSARDEILAVEGLKVTAKSLNEILESKKPGDKLKVAILRRGRNLDLEILLKPRVERSFKIQPLSRPDPLQSKILEDWLRNP